MATATGAAVGTGLGAIIGSQAGSAGGGMAIGALAGAATGAAIGSQFERQEGELEHQRLKLERQEELLKANRARLEDYRQGSDARGSLGVVNTPSGYRGSGRAVPYSAAEATDLTPAPRVPEKKLAPRQVDVPARVVEKKRVEPVLEVAEKKVTETPLENPVETPKQELPVVKSSTLPPPAGTEESMPAKSTTPPAESDGDCTKAAQEFSRAKSSVSDADRLFYLRRALRLCPSNASYHLEVGRIYNRLGRTEDADYEFRQALDLEPGNAEAKKELARLSESAR